MTFSARIGKCISLSIVFSNSLLKKRIFFRCCKILKQCLLSASIKWNKVRLFIFFSFNVCSPSEQEATKQQKPQPTWAEQSSNIIQLSDNNFSEFIKDKDVFVTFYAPWCGHCNSMKEAYFATAQNLKDESFPVVMAAVDAAQNVDLSKREKVGGYPTCKSSHDWFNSIFQRLFHHFRLIEWFVRGIVYFFASFKL